MILDLTLLTKKTKMTPIKDVKMCIPSLYELIPLSQNPRETKPSPKPIFHSSSVKVVKMPNQRSG